MNYEDLVKEALGKFNALQETFRISHNPEHYASWFYNQSTQLLRLYNDAIEEVFFRYVPIGTYSTKAKTWMWAWENASSFEQSKYECLVLAEYGKENSFSKLFSGSFESDGHAGWEFIAIASKFLGGIGGYKVNSGNLEIYMLLMEKVSPVDARKLGEKLITCDTHGQIRPAFICQHLNRETKTGFEEAFLTYPGMPLQEGDDFQAWCNECEKVRLKADGWNDDSMEFAKIRLVCEKCYFEIKEFNTGSL